MFSSLFKTGPKADIAQLIREGAIIVDVRTPGEFAAGHPKGAVNIPLDRLVSGIVKLDKSKTVITCCRSGARSGVATDLLRQNGFTAHNGGQWTIVDAQAR
ncbi:MAG: rhodanese-like domain-containing protein [Flavobacteriales bacterium]|nr:rhodanese-like domain-containing protein [Flavobacteriales bacterium]